MTAVIASLGTLLLTASLSPAEVVLGSTAGVTGAVGVPGTAVTLQSDPYPYREGFDTIARTTSAADGSFVFAGVRADRDTHLRVVVEGATSQPLTLTVDPRVSLGERSLGPGRALLTLRVRHVDLGAGTPVAVRWFIAARGSHVFRLAAVTASTELRPGLLAASATVDPPSRRFDYRVCLNPPWEAAMGPSAGHGRCPRGDFVLPASHAR